MKRGDEYPPEPAVICEAPATLDVYVDVAAEQGGTGSEECPLKTITDATHLVEASALAGVTIHVAAGTYDANGGETLPVVLPGNTVLVGKGRDETIVEGEGPLDGAAAWLGVKPSATLVLGDEGLSTVQSLTLRPTAELIEGLETLGVYCAKGSTHAGPNAEIVDVLFDRGYHRAVVVTAAAASDGCHLRLRKSEIRGAQQGVLIDAPQDHGALARAEIGVAGEGNLIQEIKARAAHDEGCVIAGDGALSVQVVDTTCVDAPSGVVFDIRVEPPVPGRRFAVEASHFLRVGRGVAVLSSATLDRLVGNRFEGGIAYGDELSALDDPRGVGLLLSSKKAKGPALPRVLHARKNVFVGNRFGVEINARISLEGAADFGRADDPGENVFRCNSTNDLGEPGGDARVFGSIIDSPDPIVLPFVGNAWDHDPPQQTGPNQFTNGLDVGFTIQVSLDVGDASLSTEECPGGKIP